MKIMKKTSIYTTTILIVGWASLLFGMQTTPLCFDPQQPSDWDLKAIKANKESMDRIEWFSIFLNRYQKNVQLGMGYAQVKEGITQARGYLTKFEQQFGMQDETRDPLAFNVQTKFNELIKKLHAIFGNDQIVERSAVYNARCEIDDFTNSLIPLYVMAGRQRGHTQLALLVAFKDLLAHEVFNVDVIPFAGVGDRLRYYASKVRRNPKTVAKVAGVAAGLIALYFAALKYQEWIVKANENEVKAVVKKHFDPLTEKVKEELAPMIAFFEKNKANKVTVMAQANSRDVVSKDFVKHYIDEVDDTIKLLSKNLEKMELGTREEALLQSQAFLHLRDETIKEYREMFEGRIRIIAKWNVLMNLYTDHHKGYPWYEIKIRLAILRKLINLYYNNSSIHEGERNIIGLEKYEKLLLTDGPTAYEAIMSEFNKCKDSENEEYRARVKVIYNQTKAELDRCIEMFKKDKLRIQVRTIDKGNPKIEIVEDEVYLGSISKNSEQTLDGAANSERLTVDRIIKEMREDYDGEAFADYAEKQMHEKVLVIDKWLLPAFSMQEKRLQKLLDAFVEQGLITTHDLNNLIAKESQV